MPKGKKKAKKKSPIVPKGLHSIESKDTGSHFFITDSEFKKIQKRSKKINRKGETNWSHYYIHSDQE